jgi:hypothetical protein
VTSPAPTDPLTLTGDHLGRRVWIQWPAPERWETGYIDSVASDQSSVIVRLRGGSEVGFLRRTAQHNPAIYLLDG